MDAEKLLTNLDEGHRRQLRDINKRIQEHKGLWSINKTASKGPDGSKQLQHWVDDPLMYEFERFMYDSGLILVFDWSKWNEGRAWFRTDDPDKYDKLDAQTALKLLTAVIRNGRFSQGAVAYAYEIGAMPRIINRLVELVDEYGDQAA